jgi:pyruvate-formate lyase-activating enzyme
LSCKTLLVDVSEYPLNFLIFPHRLTANAYVGCSHNCFCCCAKWYCKPDEIKAKVNAPEILRKELEKRNVAITVQGDSKLLLREEMIRFFDFFIAE